MRNGLILLAIFLITISGHADDGSGFLDDLMVSVPWVGYILAGLGSLAVLAQVIVLLTPTKKDDEFMKKTIVKGILNFLSKFALIKKK